MRRKSSRCTLVQVESSLHCTPESTILLTAKHHFVLISDNNCHDPAAICAHLKPILTVLKNRESIDTIHFISDSPSTQYRSLKNLFLMRKLIHLEYKFAHATWNFTEASHGKGPADGVGALVKSSADRLVNSGIDIPNATALLNALSGNMAIAMFIISEEDILEVDHVTAAADELKMLKLPALMKVGLLFQPSSQEVFGERETNNH